MIIDKFNLKAQDAIERACRLAVKKEHRWVTPWHLLYGMMEQEGGLTRHYLTEAGAALDVIGAKVDGQLLTQPKAQLDSQQTPINRELEKVFIGAEDATMGLGEKYIGINHIMLGMVESEELLAAFTEAGVQKEKLVNALKQPPKGGFKGGETLPGEFEYLAKYSKDLTEKARKGEARSGNRPG